VDQHLERLVGHLEGGEEQAREHLFRRAPLSPASAGTLHASDPS
jgi:hypothetical protein